MWGPVISSEQSGQTYNRLAKKTTSWCEVLGGLKLGQAAWDLGVYCFDTCCHVKRIDLETILRKHKICYEIELTINSR